MEHAIEYLSASSFVISLLLAIVSFFLIRTLNKIDANQTKLFEKLDRFAEEFYLLKGQHDLLMKNPKESHLVKKET